MTRWEPIPAADARGRNGGICDAAAVLDRLAPGDDGTEAAGWPFFGQLIAHDITADRSPITGGVDLERIEPAVCIFVTGHVGSCMAGVPQWTDPSTSCRRSSQDQS